MKRVLTLSLVVVSLMASAQGRLDSTQNLVPVTIVGITNSPLEPVTQTKFNCDELSYLNLQRDPFFALSVATPSIYAQSDNGHGTGYSYMRMRGLDQTRINYNLNGIPLNEMEDQGLYFSNMPGFYNYLGSINVERGVGTSKYGNTSVAGSVDMETRSLGEKTLEVNTLLKNTYNDNFTNFFYSSGLSKQGLSVQVGGSYQRNNGFKDHSGNDGGSAYYSIASVKKNNTFRLYGISGITHNQLSFYGVPKAMLDSHYLTNLNSVNDRDTFKQNMVCFNWINYTKANRKFNTSVYFNNVNGTYNTADILFGVKSYQLGAMSNMVITRNSTITNIGLNVNIYTRNHFGSDNGGYYDYPQNTQRYTNTGNKKEAIAYIKNLSTYGTTMLFYDLQARVVSFNATSSKTYNWLFINPKIGLKTTGKGVNLYATAAITQREPTRTDMLQNIIQSDSAYRYGNPDNTIFFKNNNTQMKPEIVYNVEVGQVYKNDNIDVTLNEYLLYIKNKYVATGVIDQYSGFMMKQVTNHTMRIGIESNIRVTVNKFNVFFNAQMQHNSLTNYDATTVTIPFTPNFIGSLGLVYNHKYFSLGAYEQSVSSMVMSLSDQNQISTSYQVLNMFADWKIKNIVVSLRCNNVLNQKYYIPAGVFASTPNYYVGQLSNYSLALKFKI